ncbi:MAG: hypothetical protein KIS88_01520 [Anaerolineales bacterium]|nr:hypothetical protein [Anaerolineales bacterium]
MAGYSGTPLIKKLGIKAGQRVYILGAPPGYLDLLGELPADVTLTTRLGKPHSLDFVHFFALQSSKLQIKFAELKVALRFDGSLWISWPKRSAKPSQVKSDLDENLIRQIGLDAGLVDVKVIAVDETWSALKFVYRLSDRPRR